MMIGIPSLSNRELMKVDDLELRHRLIEIDRVVRSVALVLDAYSWLSEGRGPYVYDDAGYDEEVRRMMREIVEALSS